MVTHYSSNIQNAILKELFKANESIKIAVAWFTNDLLFQPLLLKLSTGVKVEVILNKDDINTSSNGLDFQGFVNRGGELIWNTSNKLLHDKFCIIDNCVVISGSYNWTNKAEYNDESISVFTDDSTTASFYLDLFDKLSSKYDRTDKTDDVKSLKYPIKQGPYLELKFYYSVKAFKNGKYEFLFANIEENGLYAMLDNETFLPKTDYMFGQIQNFHTYCPTNVIWLRGETKWGLFDGDTLHYIVPPTFDGIQHDNSTLDQYSNPHFIVTCNGKFGLIDNKGEYLLTCEYDEIRYTGSSSIEYLKNGKYGMLYCGCKETNIIPCKYDEIKRVYWHSDQDVYFKLRQNNRWVLCHNGKIVSNVEYDNISRIYWCRGFLFEVIKDGKKGIIKEDCSFVYECTLDRISQMHLGVDTGSATLIQAGDKFGLIYQDEVVLDPIYDAIEENGVVCRRHNLRGTPKSNILILQKDGKYGLYDIPNKIYLRCEFANIQELSEHIIKPSISASAMALSILETRKKTEILLKKLGCDDANTRTHGRKLFDERKIARIERDMETLSKLGFDYRSEIKKLMDGVKKHQEHLERQCRLGYDYDGRLKKESESIKELLSKIK